MASIAYATGIFVGCLLLVTGFQKTRSGGIVLAAANYNILPYSVVRVAAPLLPWAEMVIGAGLLVGVVAPGFLSAAGALLTIFAAGILVNLLRGRAIDCGCRAESRPISWSLLGQDVGLALLCFVSATQPSSGLGVALAGRGNLPIGQALAVTCILVDLWLAYRLAATAISANSTIATWTQTLELS
jgi:hypothetical protein